MLRSNLANVIRQKCLKSSTMRTTRSLRFAIFFENINDLVVGTVMIFILIPDEKGLTPAMLYRSSDRLKLTGSMSE